MNNISSVYLAGRIEAAENFLRYAVETNASQAKQKRLCLRLLILQRLASRNITTAILQATEASRATRRAIVKGKESGVEIPLLESRAAKLEEEADAWREALATIGGRAIEILDLWELCGATLHDLAALCNLRYDHLLRKIGSEDGQGVVETFSELVAECDLDFKDMADFKTLEQDTPLTHAVTRSLIDTMINTSEGRAASRKALEETFPELWENRLYKFTDADGVQHFVDADGVEAGAPEEEI